jgi:1,4-dihydroxy-2-naphthoate polyprenyltransferase
LTALPYSDKPLSPIRVWWLAIRPKTLPAAIAPVILAIAAASTEGAFRLDVSLEILVGALLLQIASNLANDVFDFEKGADTKARLGPLRVTQAGLLSPAAMKRALIVVLLLAVGIGAPLVTVGGWPVVVIGVFAMLSAVAYTAGPYPLGYHGLGDVFAFAFFGPIAVGGTMWLEGAPLGPKFLLLGSAVGVLTTNILVVNNLRDVAQDRVANKRTLVVRLGTKAGRAQYRGLMVLAYGMVVLGVVTEVLPTLALLVFGAAPVAAWLCIKLGRSEGQKMNVLLARTAQHLLLFAVLLSLGLLVTLW